MHYFKKNIRSFYVSPQVEVGDIGESKMINIKIKICERKFKLLLIFSLWV